ncbi:MAG: type 1 glutamine amidotransferase [Woeseiaceae bacterium]
MARPRILVFQHVPYEPLGTLDPLLKQAGFRLRYINFGRNGHERPSLDGYSALIILGGPMNADDTTAYPHLATELELIKEALERDISILGICLGAQLLAKALGGQVVADAGREIGWHDVDVTADGQRDPVLSTFGTRREVFQWHDDVIELPSNVVHLASSMRCPAQAFRYGEHAYGFQFHLEADGALIERWLDVPQHQSAFADGTLDRTQIREKIGASIEPLMSLSNSTFSRWIERFEPPARRRHLPSR